MEPVDTRSDRRQRVIAAPPEAVYAAMSDPARVARWWGPEGFTNTIDEFDLRSGGQWRLTMHGPDGKHYPNLSRFAEVVPGQRLVVEHLSGHHFVLTLALEPCGPQGDSTRVHWQQTFDSAAHYRALADFVAKANEQNLDRLAAEVLRGDHDV